MIVLSDGALRVVIDDLLGADICNLTHDGVEVLFETPWRERAFAVRAGQAAMVGTSSMSRWVERYVGGWQCLTPHAGPEREYEGAILGYHGESAITTWRVEETTTTSALFTTELTTAPLAIERRICIDGDTVSWVERVANLGARAYRFDASHHPAFATALLANGVEIAAEVSTFVNAADGGWDVLEPGSRHVWPVATGSDGEAHILDHVPAASQHALFGWLTDFEVPRVQLHFPAVDLRVNLEWDRVVQPHAWVWQELNATLDWPWFGMARTIGIEPSSTSTDAGKPGICLAPGEHADIPLRMTITKGAHNGGV